MYGLGPALLGIVLMSVPRSSKSIPASFVARSIQGVQRNLCVQNLDFVICSSVTGGLLDVAIRLDLFKGNK